VILFNGQVRDDQIPLTPFSPHFQYGTGFFETILYEKGKLYFYDEHLRRIENTCKAFSFLLDKNHISQEGVINLIQSLSQKEKTLRIKIIYAPMNSLDQKKWDTLVFTEPYRRRDKPMKASLHQEGCGSSLRKYKSINYDYNRYWNSYYKQKDGSDETLFTMDGKNILEGSYTNILIRKKRNIFSIHPNLPCLPGIAQQMILDYASHKGYTLHRLTGGLNIRKLQRADEVIGTNSLLLAENIISLTRGDQSILLGKETILRDELRKHFL
jgi:branched-subunit amino acid aminotransferase/4-amino-4-deoxychorismate lyase